MSDFVFKRKLAAIGLPYCLYVAASVAQLDFWANILSPLSSLAAAGIFLYAYINSNRSNPASKIFLVFFLGISSWTIADISWLVISLLNKNPLQDLFTTVFYSVTNLFFISALALFAIYMLKKWSGIALMLDAIAISFSSIMLIWIAFFGKSQTEIQLMLSDGFISAASILLDFGIIVGILIWFISIKKVRVPYSITLIFVGLFMFSNNDLVYYYLYYHELYSPNTLLDAIYNLSFVVIAIGALLYSRIPIAERHHSFFYSNIGFKRKGFLLVAFLAAAIIAEGFVINDIFVFLFIIAVYEAASGFVQNAVKNEELLQKEISMKLALERLLEEKTSELVLLANQDTVTKLYNRRYFIEALEDTLKEMKPNELLAIMFIDADRFKTINDTYGHDIGDKVLIEIADRLMKWNSYGAVLARLGGDEFVLMFHGRYQRCDIEALAKELINVFKDTIVVERYVINITFSIGISVSPSDAYDAVTLMRFADMAMYRAKALGYNKYMFFDPLINEHVFKKNELELMMWKANINEEFELFYQPQFSVPEMEIIGAEALLRWKNGNKGYILPGEFISVAEEIGFIIKIGAWVINEAFIQLEKWNSMYSQKLKIGINVSPKQISDGSFINTLNKILEEHRFSSIWVDIEITENVMLVDKIEVEGTFDLLKELGFSLSLDDFGTGYSSLGYLNKYRFDRIKLDKSLIDSISSDINDKKIVKAIISMANSLGIKTIAEGVETQEQLDVLLEMGCDQIQGFLLGRPVPASEFEELFLNGVKNTQIK